jgi:hypothetical protein
MTYNRPDPQVHHWLIPHKLLQCGLDSIFIRVSQLSAIFFMQLGGKFQLAGSGVGIEDSEVKVTAMVHPDAVFVVHSFGHRLPAESRAFGKGLADNKFMRGGMDAGTRPVAPSPIRKISWR